MKSKLAICYRIYPGISKIPAIHSNNKLKMSELCLRSFVRALDNIDAKIWVILDNCPQDYNSLFDKYLAGYQYELINVNKLGNAATFQMQMDILSKQNFSENIFFAEDDYFYLPKALYWTMQFFEQKKCDFCTPYDHPDIYQRNIHNYKFETIQFGNFKWREVASTTMTFITTKQKLQENYSTLSTYSKLNYDASMWFAMTQMNLSNPITIIANSFKNYSDFRIYLKILKYTPFFFLKKKVKLMSPIPTLATHLDNLGLPDYIDWNTEFEKLNHGI